jgi:hypothetical protein
MERFGNFRGYCRLQDVKYCFAVRTELDRLPFLAPIYCHGDRMQTSDAGYFFRTEADLAHEEASRSRPVL